MDLKEAITDPVGKESYENELERVLDILHASALMKRAIVLNVKGVETSQSCILSGGVSVGVKTFRGFGEKYRRRGDKQRG